MPNSYDARTSFSLQPAITPSDWAHNRTEWPADPREGDEAGEASLVDIDGDGTDIHLVIDVFEHPENPEVFRTVSVPNYARKGLAALCLTDTAFGFTHEERDAIMTCVQAAATGTIAPAEARTLATAAAAKIFALLKPAVASPP